MKQKPRIVVTDRSALAGNLYKLLFAELGAIITVRRSFEDTRDLFLRREKVDLAIFNSNVFGKKYDEILSAFKTDSNIIRVKKIFLCREAEKAWRKELSRLGDSQTILRPFYPDDFLTLVKESLSEPAHERKTTS